MEASLSSKVTVEYHDPSGVFPLISRDLASRLPLRNLNWKSPTRPLRSIGALHLEFVPDAATAAAQNATDTLQRVDSYGARSEGGAPVPGKERRHQIPGLRQTPYLKLYLLRCDDKDTYKAKDRQLLRDWIRDIQGSTSLNKAEQHDASEWLIVHVVIPNTLAASEPRWTAASKKDPDELAERPQSIAKWPGKSTRTVLDKIRADFNPSAKSTQDRVAQVRLQKKNVPAQLLPAPPAVTSTYVETAQEQENDWQDIVLKFKTLILASFDMRVSQYEEDIREKDSQRALPGWNFCTFFTLKEGLARGFESVGLVEDALAIYDELAAGLESAVRDDGSTHVLGDMSAYSKALQQLQSTKTGGDDQSKLAESLRDLFNQPLDLTRKDYRGAIVSSTISLFDFQLYIFARQRSLLLRMGSAVGTPQQIKSLAAQTALKEQNLALSAEVCRRSAIFAATNSRALRTGLQQGYENSVSSQLSTLVEHLTSSWTHAVLDQVLSETTSDKLPAVKSDLELSAVPSQKIGSRKESGSFNFPQGANTHPNRTSSLQRTSSSSSQTLHSPQVVYENERHTKSSSSVPSNATSTSGSGLSDLAAGRAELFLMKRRVLEALAKRKGWLTGWAAIVQKESLADVDLSDTASSNAPAPEADPEEKEGLVEVAALLLSSSLSSALSSEDKFRSEYEHLTKIAGTNYTTAGHTKAADLIVTDLAVLKFQLKDYAQAATYFQRSSPAFIQGNWTYLHGEMLRVYAKCLEQLHRRDEYMRVMLSLLGKAITKKRARSLPIARSPDFQKSVTWLDEEAIDVQGLLEGIIAYSEKLPKIFVSPMSDFFSEIHVNPEVQHHDGKDGFGLDVRFRHMLEDELSLGRVRLRLVHSKDPSQEIWLQNEGQMTVRQGVARVKVESNITTYGVYLIDKLVLEAKKLHFIKEFQPKPQSTPLGITNATASERKAPTGPAVLIYPHGDAFDARITLTRQIHIDKPRHLIIAASTGWNQIDKLDIRLRSASAGLRLHTADAIWLDAPDANLNTSQAGTIGVGEVSAQTELKLQVPYSLEHSLDELAVKLEATYQTTHGSFAFTCTAMIPVYLPLDVDVHDIFKAHALFSKFSIRTTNMVPLHVTGVELQDSPAFAVQALPCPPQMTVFERQPASLTYRITRKDGVTREIPKAEAALAMTVRYTCMDEMIFEAMEAAFTDSLLQSPYSGLKRLLVPVLLNGAQSHALALQLEQASLLGEVRMPTYQEIGWSGVVNTLASETRIGLVEWLQAWHKQTTTLHLDLSPSSDPRKITITVDVPTIDVVLTATLTLAPQPPLPQPPVHPLNSPIPALLRITHTRLWSSTPSTSPLSFLYHLTDPSDAWLIGGQRRAHFTLRTEHDVFSTKLLLIPLKPGTHLLPTVDVVSAATSEDKTKRSSMLALSTRQDVELGALGPPASAQGAVLGEVQTLDVACETDYRNAGVVVVVRGEAGTKSVGVREMGGLGGAGGLMFSGTGGVAAGAGGGSTVEGSGSVRASMESRVSRVERAA